MKKGADGLVSNIEEEDVVLGQWYTYIIDNPIESIMILNMNVNDDTSTVGYMRAYPGGVGPVVVGKNTVWGLFNVHHYRIEPRNFKPGKISEFAMHKAIRIIFG
jgi:hypothetical protein